MNTAVKDPSNPGEVVRKEAYYKPEYVALEKERFWPRVWQVACREEELRAPGDYITYNLYDESIVVVRGRDSRVRAFYNVCQHRGRRLAEGCGKASQFRCKFHGWQYDLEGKNISVTQREAWGDLLDRADINLKPVSVDSWGGFVFVNLDPNCEPLAEFLGDVPGLLAPFQLEKMRYGWRKWLIMPCNWKIALESFNEGYHVGVTHPQLLRYGIDHFLSSNFGKHSMFGTSNETGSMGLNTSREEEVDIRESLADYYRYMKTGLDSTLTDTLVSVAERLPVDLPVGTPRSKVMEYFTVTAMQTDAARGVAWPAITTEQYLSAGVDWHIFPNIVLLQMATNCLVYRSRPNGDDPDSCIFEVFHLELFPNGKEPMVESVRNDDIYDLEFWGEVLLQDFQQMQETHRGIKSFGYKGPCLNPLQETPISNFNRVYLEYLSRP
jgi:nitrite reductase/ring-hydroxylating ferredoxin subunit